MVSLNVKQLLEAGVHFGHQTRHWNPKMARYIFGERNGIYIIDLEKTMHGLEKACQFLKETAEKGGWILFVGTKKQGQEVVKTAAHKCGMPYVHQRWLGGMLTNFETIRKSVARLDEIEKMEAEGTYRFLTKKEVAQLQKQREKLLKVLAGVRPMKRIPAALFVVDPKQEEIAVKEARRLGIPIVAIIDTNCDPDMVDYLIPGNDDAIRSVKLICEIVGDAILEGRQQHLQIARDQEAAEAEEKEREEARTPHDETAGAEEIVDVIAEDVTVKLVDREVVKSKGKKTKTHKGETA